MKAYKSTVLLGASTAARMLLALYTVKITAVTLGLSGTGVIGQFNNLLLITTMIAGGGIASGIVNVASNVNQPTDEVQERLRSAHGYACVWSVLILLAALAGHDSLTRWLLPIEYGATLLIALAVGQFVLFHIAALSALVNSCGRQDLFAKSSLGAGLVSAVTVTLGCRHYGLPGTLAGLLVGALSQYLFLLIMARSALPVLSSLGRPKLVWGDWRFWGHFSAISMMTIVGMPTAQMGVRNALATTAGWEIVGIWQAMVRLSDAYLQFGLLVLSSFYFPRLASAPNLLARKAIIKRYARLLVPGMIVICLCIYSLRFFIVPLLFSSKFIGVTDLFLPQLVGDVFKVTSYLITYAFLATGYYKLSMAVELTQAALFWFLATQFGLPQGALGVTWSYAVTYSIYFLLVLTTFSIIVRRTATVPNAARQ